MKKCNSCEFENSDDSQFCANCGAALGGTQNADPFGDVAPAVELNSNDGNKDATATANGDGFKGKAMAARNKVMAFESKHRLIVNLLLAVCALIIALVALFAPVKVTNITMPEGFGHYEAIEETSADNYEYVSVDQSIFQMIGALTYINANEEKQAELAQDLVAAMLSGDESDINWLALVIAFSSVSSGTFYSAVVSAAFGAIIALLAIIMAIISLVYIIKAIIGMVKKQPQEKLFKYFGSMMSLSGSGLSLMFVAPMLKAGGGMFGVLLFVGLMMILCGATVSLLTGRESWLLMLKHSITAVVTMIAFFILCSNIFCLKYDDGTKVNGAASFPFNGAVLLMDIMGEGSKSTFAIYITGLVFYVLVALFAMPYALKAMQRAFNRAAYGESAKSPKASMIVAAVFMLIAIIAGLGFSDNIAVSLSKMFGEPLAVAPKWIMNAQVWASMILLIIATVFEFAFKPKNKQPDATAQQPVQQNIEIA